MATVQIHCILWLTVEIRSLFSVSHVLKMFFCTLTFQLNKVAIFSPIERRKISTSPDRKKRSFWICTAQSFMSVFSRSISMLPTQTPTVEQSIQTPVSTLTADVFVSIEFVSKRRNYLNSK